MESMKCANTLKLGKSQVLMEVCRQFMGAPPMDKFILHHFSGWIWGPANKNVFHVIGEKFVEAGWFKIDETTIARMASFEVMDGNANSVRMEFDNDSN